MTGDSLREFDDGVAYWATRPQWPCDLHNAFCGDQQAITDGTFSPIWWARTRRKLGMSALVRHLGVSVIRHG